MIDRPEENSNSPAAELENLIDSYFAGTVSPEGLARLDGILQTDPKARRLYRDHSQLHAFLTWRVRGVAERDVLERMTMDASPSAARRFAKVPRRLRRAAAGIGIAVLAFAIGTVVWMSLRAPVVASLTHSVRAQWAPGSAHADGAALRAGQQLQLQAGVVGLKFDNGARVILQGPATFRVEGRDKGHLEAGMLTAHVPPPAYGFTISTPNATVVDQGTEFGLVVLPAGAATHTQPGPSRGKALAAESTHSKSEVANQYSSTEVHVFEGMVELAAPTPTRTAHPAKLAAGGAVKWEQHQQARPLAAAQPDRFTRAITSQGPIKIDLGNKEGNVQEGWIGIDTPNMVTPAPLTVASAYAAQGSTVTIKLSVGALKEYASRYRGEIIHPLANLVEDFHMHRGTKPLSVTFSNLAAGTYRLTSFHHDVYRNENSQDPTGFEPPQRLTATVRGAMSFDVSGATNFAATQGKNPDPPGTGVLTFVADGTRDITVSYAVIDGIAPPHNGFILETLGK